MRKISLKSFMAALLLAAISNGAHADYPERMILFVVTTAPGTSGDIIARLLTPKLSERLKQTIIVENKPGANGNLAAGEVALFQNEMATPPLIPVPSGTLVANLFLYRKGIVICPCPRSRRSRLVVAHS